MAYMKPVLEYPGYQVTPCGEVWSDYTNRWLVQFTHRRGYKTVLIKVAGDYSRQRYVHRLVASVFIPNPRNFEQVNHIDGNKANNWVDNLEWVDQIANSMHAIEHGLMPHAQINEELAHVICQRISAGEGTQQIATDLDVPYSTIHAIRRGNNWTHVSSRYDFPSLRPRSQELSQDIVRKIYCDLVHHRYSRVDVARMYNTSIDVVRRIESGQNYSSYTEDLRK